MNVSAFTYDGKKTSLCHYDLSRHLTSCLRFCRSHSMRINLFCYPCLFILSVKLLMLFNFIYYLKSSNFKSSILQHSLLPYLQTESNVKSPWQQLSGVWEIIGFIASFIIHSKINNFHYISLMYYQTLCKKGHAHLAENYKKWKPDLFLNFRCGHGCTFCFHIYCSHSHWASFSYLGKDLRLDMCFLKLKSVRSCALILKPNSVRWWERAHLCVRARVCVCVCVFVRIAAELCHARYREKRIVNARPCRDKNYMPSCKIRRSEA